MCICGWRLEIFVFMEYHRKLLYMVYECTTVSATAYSHWRCLLFCDYNLFVHDFLPRFNLPPALCYHSCHREKSCWNGTLENFNFFLFLISARIRQQVDVVIAWSFSFVSAATTAIYYFTFFCNYYLVFSFCTDSTYSCRLITLVVFVV